MLWEFSNDILGDLIWCMFIIWKFCPKKLGHSRISTPKMIFHLGVLRVHLLCVLSHLCDYVWVSRQSFDLFLFLCVLVLLLKFGPIFYLGACNFCITLCWKSILGVGRAPKLVLWHLVDQLNFTQWFVETNYMIFY